jgi:hypothetical protein
MNKTIVQKMREALRQPVPYEGLLGREFSLYGEDVVKRPKDGNEHSAADEEGSELRRQFNRLALHEPQSD